MTRKNTTELETGDIVINAGMRILIDGPARVYPAHGSSSGTVYAWPGLVLNADALCDKDSPDYDDYIARHLRGIWFEDRMEPKRKDDWTIQGTDMALWHIGEPWREQDAMCEAGEPGGDIQCGKAFGRRFTHTKLFGRVYEITAYPVMGDGTDPMHPDGVIRIQQEICTTICRDVDEVGSTEEWSEYAYPDLPEHCDIDFATAESAEAAARYYVKTFDPEHIGWDGCPSYTVECRYSTKHMHAGVPAITSLDCGRVGKVPACQACADFYTRQSEKK